MESKYNLYDKNYRKESPIISLKDATQRGIPATTATNCCCRDFSVQTEIYLTGVRACASDEALIAQLHSRQHNNHKQQHPLDVDRGESLANGNYCQAFEVSFFTITHNATLQKWVDEDECQLNIKKEKHLNAFRGGHLSA